jgi:excisionase family DNA binding protein
MEQRFLTLEEFASQMGVSVKTARNLAKRGDLPTVRVGRLHRIDPNELERWLKAGGTGAPAAEKEPVA